MVVFSTVTDCRGFITIELERWCFFAVTLSEPRSDRCQVLYWNQVVILDGSIPTTDSLHRFQAPAVEPAAPVVLIAVGSGVNTNRVPTPQGPFNQVKFKRWGIWWDLIKFLKHKHCWSNRDKQCVALEFLYIHHQRKETKAALVIITSKLIIEKTIVSNLVQ